MSKLERVLFRPRTRDDLARAAVLSPSREEFVRTHLMGPGNRAPLMIEPMDHDLDLVDWARDSRDRIEAQSVEFGALLFRGFQVDKSVFSRFARAVCPEPFEREADVNRENAAMQTYQPSFYPADKKLLWHNEDNFDHSRWPAQIMFCCHQPAAQGGETTIVDSRAVFNAIDPAIRKRFARKQVMYVRNYWKTLGHDWKPELRVSTRDEVEHYCAANDIGCEWVEGERLRLRWVRPAIQVHPKTRESVWFNLLIHWHPSHFEAAQQQAMAETFRVEDLPGNCCYGDGSPIEASIVSEILAAYQDLEICFPWYSGDILLLDNMLYAHGRNPYSGERRLEVAMGGSLHYRDLAFDQVTLCQ